MKTFSGTFANGEKYMGVEANEEGFDHEVYKTNCPNGFYYLGKYHTKGEIDFRVNERWVERHPNHPEFYTCYGEYNMVSGNKFASLISLLDRDSRKAFPLEDEMEGWADNIIEGLTYEQHEKKVRPKTFLIILVK